MEQQPVGAAVAVIVLERLDREFLLLKRAANPSDPWAGHWAFPGGKKEPGDANLFATCLRETAEESGVLLTPADLVEELPTALAGSQVERRVPVAPFLFRLRERPSIRLDETEMAAHAWIPESVLRHPGGWGEAPFGASGRFFPYLRLPPGAIEGLARRDEGPVPEERLWGFTLGVLARLLGLPPARRPPPSFDD